ncbi:MAG: accessory factor UbiK family protein [Bdellovibrionales bacterium]
MRKREKILDDAARFAGGTIGVASGISHNIRAEIKARIDEIADHLDLVPREDLDRMEIMLQETRKQNGDLEKRLEALEKNTSKKKK